MTALKKSFADVQAKEKNFAWHAIMVLLCAHPSKENRQFIARMLAPKVERDIGDGDENAPPKLVNPQDLTIDDLFAQGAAFGATFAEGPGQIIVNYYRDEACVASKTLKYARHRWRLTGVGVGCD